MPGPAVIELVYGGDVQIMSFPPSFESLIRVQTLKMTKKSLKKKNDSPYITCPFKKGRPRKHITVCQECPRRGRCKPFLDYIQPGLF